MADPESQRTPLAPAVVKNEQTFNSIGKFTKRNHQESSKCLVYVLAAFVFLGIIFLIFASVFLRVVNPKLRLSSVSIQNLQFENFNSTSTLNVTMLTEVTVNNKNFGRYDFENCNAVILYGNSKIGGGDISGGRVGARNTKSFSVVMQIGSENLNLSSGGGARTELMEVITYAKMTGRVHVLKIIDRSRTIEMNCTMNLNLTSRSIMDSVCT